MNLVIDDAYLPVTLTAAPMSDEQSTMFCSQYADYFIEMTAEGEILIALPNYLLTSVRNGFIGAQLVGWATSDHRGVVTDATSGFVLPNGARRSPDTAWVMKSRVLTLDETSLRGFWHLCPDFVIELRSRTDGLPVLRAKMREWISNGAQLAWLIDPERKAVEIFRPGLEPAIRAGIDQIAGEPPVEGFELDLRPVWDPLAF